MKKLLAAALLASCATPALASTYSLSGWTAQAGNPETFTITRTETRDRYVSFRTGASGDTAQPGADYTPIYAVTVHLVRGQLRATVQVATHINQAQLGRTLTFTGLLTVGGVVTSSASASIIEPMPQPATIVCPDGQIIPAGTNCPAPPPPTTQTCPDGSVIAVTSTCPVAPPPPPPVPLGQALALLSCPALNRPDSIVAGKLYTVVGFGGVVQPTDPPPPAGTKDIVILNDATHFGDGYLGLYVPASCVTMG